MGLTPAACSLCTRSRTKTRFVDGEKGREKWGDVVDGYFTGIELRWSLQARLGAEQEGADAEVGETFAIKVLKTC